MDELAILGKALSQFGPRHRGRAMPAELRARLVEAARSAQQAGASQREIGSRLGVAPETVRRWLITEPELRPVIIRDAVEVPAAPQPLRLLTLTAPSGWRVEGLVLSDLLPLLERLR